MKRISLVVFLAALSVAALWANGNAEQLSVAEGTVLQVTPLQTEARVELQLASGETVEVILPVEEAARMNIREQAQIKFEGVLVQEDTGTQTQTRLYARTYEVNGKQEQIQNAIQLSTQDQEQLRQRSKDGSGDQVQNQTQTQTQSKTNSGTNAQDQSGSNN